MKTHGPNNTRAVAASITKFSWTNSIWVDDYHDTIAGRSRDAAAELIYKAGDLIHMLDGTPFTAAE